MDGRRLTGQNHRRDPRSVPAQVIVTRNEELGHLVRPQTPSALAAAFRLR
jgi:hypothetical protein